MQVRPYSWVWQISLALLLIGAVGILLSPMIRNGYPLVHSVHFNLMWAFQYSQQVLGGQLYPRWLEGSYFGLGNPTFVFYPPLCMVAVLPFTLLKVPTSSALIASMGLATGIRGWGAYRASRCFWPKIVSLGVALVAMASPYFMLDIYVRGAIGEVWGLSLTPWILWAGWRFLQKEAAGESTSVPFWVWSITWTLMALTHLPALLVWTLAWLVWPWCLSKTRAELLKRLGQSYGALGLGLLFAAFFLLPAILDQHWISIQYINGWDMYDPLQRFMIVFDQGIQLTTHAFDQLLLPYFWLPLALTLAVGSLLAWDPVYRQELAWRSFIGLGLMTLMGSIMMTNLSAPLYQASTSLTRIQFPWRWMVVTASTLPFLVGYSLDWAIRQNRPWKKSLGLILGLLSVGISFWQTAQVTQVSYYPDLLRRFDQIMIQRPPFPKEPAVDLEKAEHFLGWHWAYPEGIAFVDAFEYRPHTAGGNPLPPSKTYPLVDWIQGEGFVIIHQWKYGYRNLQIQVGEPGGSIALRTFAYPGWAIWIDGKRRQPGIHGDGRIQIDLPTGQHKIKLVYQGTAAEQWGSWLSWGSLALSLVILGIHQYPFSLKSPFFVSSYRRD